MGIAEKKGGLPVFDSDIHFFYQLLKLPPHSRVKLERIPAAERLSSQQKEFLSPFILPEVSDLVYFLSLWSVYDRKQMFWKEGNFFFLHQWSKKKKKFCQSAVDHPAWQ